jgi:ribosomal protein S10
MNLPARGPVSLPRKVELWTVPRSNFAHKKSQENFNRITVRRLIQIQDGHSETVQKWLAYLVQRGFAGVGMKANIYDWEGLGVAERMDAGAQEALADFKESWGNFSIRDNEKTAEKVEEFFSNEKLEKVPRIAEHFIREPVEITRPKPKK